MTFDDLLPFIWPSCTACPRDTVIHHTRQAAIEFFDRTGVWTLDLDTLLADGYSSAYALPLNDQTELSKLIEVTTRASATARPEEADLTDGLEGRRAMRFGCVGLIAWVEDRRQLGIYPAPVAGATIDVVAALKPSQAAFTVPDEVMAHHAEAIAQGALMRIFAMPQCDWTSLPDAQVARGIFNDAVSTTSRTAERGFTRRVRPKTERFL